jgi:hypothetical protein
MLSVTAIGTAMQVAVGGFLGAAHADTITATWQGIIPTASVGGTACNVSGCTSLAGDPITMTLTYDPASIGPLYPAGSPPAYYGTTGTLNPGGGYSSATVSIGDSGSFSFTGPAPYWGFNVADGTTTYQDFYNTGETDGTNVIDGYFISPTPGVVSLSTSQTFTYDVATDDTAVALFGFTTDGTTYSGSISGPVWQRVTVCDSNGNCGVSNAPATGAPAPASLALLGLGLIGIGGMRRKTKVA